MGFLQFPSLNLPENHGFYTIICSFHQNLWICTKIHSFCTKKCGFYQNPQFSSKSAVFVKNHGFDQKILDFHQKPWIFIKICGLPQNPHFLAFLSEPLRGQHQIGILCEMKDHLPRKVTPIF